MGDLDPKDASAISKSKPFTRLHTAEEYPGTGVGLVAICRRIVQAQGGRICAESVLGEGTTLFSRFRWKAEPH
ncbi:MAG: hypothetical protein SGI92_14775 [Bryobacteraceae bacterium]|nr:hypothetical protein [Bryobacteraceae bacterium]